jgi:azurin
MKKRILALAAALFAPLAMAQEAKVEITANDQMQYNLKTFEVTAGDKVTLTLKHIGQLPKVAMGHNVVVLKTGTAVPDFAMKATPAKDHDYIPQDAESKDKIIAHTKMIGGGESDTITFTAPAAGTYPFLCTFPGHFAMMQGTMTVKAK